MEIQRGNWASILGTVVSPGLLEELFDLFYTKSDNFLQNLPSGIAVKWLHTYNEYPDALSFSKDRIPKFYNFFLLKQIKNEQDTL